MLSEQEIMKMYSELVRPQYESTNRKNYYKSYRKRVRQSETPEQIYKRRESDRVHKASVKQTEAPEQSSKRKQSNRQCKASVKQVETNKLQIDVTITGNVRRHQGHKKHQNRLSNNNK